MADRPPIIVWYRDDLRLSDHPALHAAAKTRAPVITLFVLDEASAGVRRLGGAVRWWLAQSLRALAASLEAKGGPLVLRRGPAAKVVAEVAREAGAGAVYWNDIAQAPHQAVAKQVKAALAKLGVDSQSFAGDPLVRPGEIRNQESRGLRVFTPVASFLVKHLLIDWRCGERWFWDTLVDADAGSNPANWQWVAGCGADAVPYFRVFNPVLQGEKFDPDGDYVRRWVGELAKLPADLIHEPWRATPIELKSADVELGRDYPEPIVDHKQGRERALAAYAKLRAR